MSRVDATRNEILGMNKITTAVSSTLNAPIFESRGGMNAILQMRVSSSCKDLSLTRLSLAQRDNVLKVTGGVTAAM